jgi:pimeloyl-ACP methyl ester carboxylesterase
MKPSIVALSALLAVGSASAAPVESFVEAPGPQGPLKATMLAPGNPDAPVVLIIPGSGPTDRAGNNTLGVKGSSYRLLAEGLAQRGVASVRVDKRGMFGSRAAVADANDVTIEDYADDVHAWIDVIRKLSGGRCVWALGHSDGGLVALAAATKADGLCGVALVSAPGRPVGDVLRDQLKANPANAPILDDALKTVQHLENGGDRKANMASYSDPNLPLGPGVVDAVAGFISAPR